MSAYVAVKPDFSTADKLSSMMWVIGVDDPVPREQMHLTLMHDDREDTPEVTPSDGQYSANVDSVGLLGNGLVLYLNSSDLLNRHEQLKNSGLVHSFPSLTPHITVKYNPVDGDLEKVTNAINSIKLVTQNMTLNNEIVDKIT